MSTEIPPVTQTPAPLRYLDLIVLLTALPVFLALGFPLLGYAVGAGCYLGQRILAMYLTTRAQNAKEITGMVGLTLGSMIGRGWAVALAIFTAGYWLGREVGLAAALLFLAAFSVYFTSSLVLRPLRKSTT